MAEPVTNQSSNHAASPPSSTSSEDFTDACVFLSYQMKSYPRGICTIINNKVFRNMNEREGTDADATALQQLFTHFGFYTSRYNNLTGNQMRRLFKDIASKDHSKFDCLLVAVLTHGTKGKLYGTDGKLVPVEEITELFSGDKCPSLTGKPKIFLLQACRGERKDKGVKYDMTDGSDPQSVNEADMDDDETDSAYTGSLPAEADFLLAYSTIPGYVSWRDQKDGSWFVSTLVNVFMEMAATEHLLDMLTEVNRRVAEDLISGKHKQVPEPVTRLRKRLYFRPGKYD